MFWNCQCLALKSGIEITVTLSGNMNIQSFITLMQRSCSFSHLLSSTGTSTWSSVSLFTTERNTDWVTRLYHCRNHKHENIAGTTGRNLCECLWLTPVVWSQHPLIIMYTWHYDTVLNTEMKHHEAKAESPQTSAWVTGSLSATRGSMLSLSLELSRTR